MYNALFLSSDSGFLLLTQKFVPHIDGSISVKISKSIAEISSAFTTMPIDVVVLDHSEDVPIADAIRSFWRIGAKMPIVLVSKSMTVEELSEAINLGISAFVDRESAEPLDYFREICNRIILAAERVRLSEDRLANEKRLETIIKIAKMNDKDFSEIVNFALDSAIEITKSKVGFVAKFDRSTKILRMLAWSKSAMKMCAMMNYPVEFDLDSTGVWGEPIRSGKSIIINDYDGDRRLLKKGVPTGHIPLKKLLLVPLFSRGGDIIGTAGVANKADDYTSNDEFQFSHLMGEIFNTFAKREELNRAIAPAQVLRELTDVGTTGLVFLTIDFDLAYVNKPGIAILGLDKSNRYPIPAHDIENENLKKVLDLVNRLRSHGGPFIKGDMSAVVNDDVRSYSITVYSTAGLGDMHPGFTVFIEDVTNIKRMLDNSKRIKEHVSILEGPVLDSLLSSRRMIPEDNTSEPAFKRIDETIQFMKCYRNVGMTEPIWIDIEDALRKASNNCIPARVRTAFRTNGIKILADPAFTSVFKQLFMNSLDHGGFVSDISIRCSIKDGRLKIVYDDNGIGILPEMREKVFNQVYDGKFGLFLVYNIVSASGFDIRCMDSEKGAEFEIDIPPSHYSLG